MYICMYMDKYIHKHEYINSLRISKHTQHTNFEITNNCIYARMYVHTYICACIHTHMLNCMYADSILNILRFSTYICTCVRTFLPNTYIYIYMYMQAPLYINISIYKCLHVCVCVYTHIFTNKYLYVFTYTLVSM